MSRTNHDAKATHEARAAREAEEYRQRIEARDTRRQFREQIRELGECSGGWLINVPLTLAAIT